MNEQAQKIWKTPHGVSLFGKMLEGKPLDQQDKTTLNQLKTADPPTKSFQPTKKLER